MILVKSILYEMRFGPREVTLCEVMSHQCDYLLPDIYIIIIITYCYYCCFEKEIRNFRFNFACEGAGGGMTHKFSLLHFFFQKLKFKMEGATLND